ncbi:hypothetical protein DITRI_Ditri04bG0111000 [Diplodiscus trichospermus]
MGAFNKYGREMDIFIPVKDKCRRKATMFAFVRYKYEFKMKRAVEAGNNRRIDGWNIVVKRANHGWKEKLFGKEKRGNGNEA